MGRTLESVLEGSGRVVMAVGVNSSSDGTSLNTVPPLGSIDPLLGIVKPEEVFISKSLKVCD